MREKKQKAVGYDKYIDWKVFVFPVLLLFSILLLPPLEGMRDVGTEYSRPLKLLKERMRERKMMRWPSGVHVITMLFGPMRSETSSRPSVGV